MIENEQQYQTTKAWAQEFTETLDRLDSDPDEGTQRNLLLRKAERAGLVSQIETLQKEVREYEALQC